jgi:hypothetical protein
MNKRVVLLGLPLVLLVAIVAGIGSLPQAHATGYPAGAGTVCLLDSSASISLSPPGPCQTVGPYTFSGPYPSTPQTGPTQIRVGVYVNGSAGLDAFSIILVSNSSTLQPAGVDLTGTVLQGTPQVLLECLSDVLVQGTSCSSVDNGNTLEFAASSALGQPLTAAPTTGLLFTAIYNIVGSTSGPISIGFQTGCGTTTSVSDGSCVTVANGSTSPDGELLQAALFDNSAGNSVLSWYYEQVTSNDVTVPLNAASGNAVNLTASAPNGFPVLGGTTVVFSTSTTPGFGAPNFFGNPTYTCSAFAGSPLTCATEITFSTSTPGSYDVTVYMSYVGDNCANSVPCTATYSLVGTTVIQVNVQAVAWSIDSDSSSKAQTLYMAEGASNPLSLLFTAQSLGGYTGTITYQTNTLTDGGTGISFSYPASFVLAAGQTISQTVTATATVQGTALYQAALITSAPTLANQSSAVLTIHVTGFGIVAVSPSISFAAFGSGTDSITLQSLPASTAGFAGKVLLSQTVIGGPVTVTCPVSLTLTVGGTVSGTCTFSGSVAGVYSVVVTGIGGTNNAITNSTTIQVTVTSTTPSFTITASPTSATGTIDTALASILSMSSQGGLGGTVSLSYSSSPSSGITCGFSNTGIPAPSGTSTLSCSSAIAGTFTVTVNGNDGSASASATIIFTFTLYTPSVTTTVAPPNIIVGSSATDLATLTGGLSPTGTVTYDAYSNAVCTTLVFTSTVPVGAASAPFAPTIAGTYFFVASYSGDANNSPATSACGASSETLVVVPATPALTTTILNAAGAPVTTVTVGTTVFDTATLTGGYPASGVTGTVSYTFFANSNCAPPGIPEGTVVIGPGNSVGPSNPVTITVPGSYSFQASYSGDANNNPVVGACETLTATDFVITMSPTIVNTTPDVPGTSTIAVSPVNGFTDTVALTDTIAPSQGLTCTFNPASISGGTGTSILSCSGVGGTYMVTVTGTDGALANSATVVVNVADFRITASPTSLSIVQGAAASSTITVMSVGGFSGTVTFLPLNFAPSTHLTVTLAPSSVVMSGSAILTVNTTLTTPTGTYFANVTGTSGNLGHSVIVTIVVTPQTAIAPFFLVTWLHRVSLSQNHGVETWTYYALNINGNKPVYAAITVTGVDSHGTSSFTETTQVFTINPLSLVSGSLSQTFTGADLGNTYHFTIAIRWGTTATTNPTALPYVGFYSLSGSFTVTA